jgi:hypothetical protein
MAHPRFKRLAQVLAAGAVLALVGTAPVASAAPLRTVPVFAHFDDAGVVTPSTIPCDGGQAVHGHATFGGHTGDTWTGTADYDFCLKPGPVANTLVYSGTGTFTGTARGCGTGSMGYEVRNGFVDQQQNPTAPNGFEEWRVRPGTGTGGLAGVTAGQGVGVYTIFPTLANNGIFAGSLTCASQ